MEWVNIYGEWECYENYSYTCN